MTSLDPAACKNRVGPIDSRPASEPRVLQVSDVPLATTALREVPYKVAVESLLTKPPSQWPPSKTKVPAKQVEACSRYHGRLVVGVHFHPVVAAIHLAFHDHRPLVLSPDIIWLLVAQGFASHVNANAEGLRERLVKHHGKLVINVRRDDFVKGSPENPWAEVFDDFSEHIRDHVGVATHELLLPTFSTTGAVEKATAQIVMLDAMQSFFSYEFDTLCGIPRIVLQGTADDWENLVKRARDLGRFDLEWWIKSLAPILEEFAAAARGAVNPRFWQSIYKLNGGSGGPYTTGWLTAFFPYLKDRRGKATTRNPWLLRDEDEIRHVLYPPAKRDRHRFAPGPKTDAFPSGLARAPVVWRYLLETYSIEFLGGFVGVRQDPNTLELKPEIGWAIREAMTS